MIVYLQDEFGGDGVDLYDDVIGPPAGVAASAPETGGAPAPVTNAPLPDFHVNNGPRHSAPPSAQQHQPAPSHPPPSGGQPRRYQLYIGNLTWVI